MLLAVEVFLLKLTVILNTNLIKFSVLLLFVWISVDKSILFMTVNNKI